MSAFEIAITVLLSFITTCAIMLSCQAYLLLGKIIDRLNSKKKPASKNEADDKK